MKLLTRAERVRQTKSASSSDYYRPPYRLLWDEAARRGFFVFDVPPRLQRLNGSSGNKSLVRGGCLAPLRGAETTVTRTFQIA